VHFAAAGVISGQYDIAVAGGVEVMSRTPMGSSFTASPLGADYIARYGADLPNQGVGAEHIAESYSLSRQQLDEYALQSHARAASAVDEGRFAGQIVPVTPAEGVVVDTDEGVRSGLRAAPYAYVGVAVTGCVTAHSDDQESESDTEGPPRLGFA